MNARERADRLMDEKRLAKYPAHVRKIKRLRQQIRDLNRCIRKIKPAAEFASNMGTLLETIEAEYNQLLTFPVQRTTFHS